MPEFHGRGFATELALAGVQAAAAVDSNLPVVALLLEHHRASEAVARKLGLRRVWQGPAVEPRDLNMTRVIYADRPLSDVTIHDFLRGLV